MTSVCHVDPAFSVSYVSGILLYYDLCLILYPVLMSVINLFQFGSGHEFSLMLILL